VRIIRYDGGMRGTMFVRVIRYGGDMRGTMVVLVIRYDGGTYNKVRYWCV
jgi:hypothetical protein